VSSQKCWGPPGKYGNPVATVHCTGRRVRCAARHRRPRRPARLAGPNVLVERGPALPVWAGTRSEGGTGGVAGVTLPRRMVPTRSRLARRGQPGGCARRVYGLACNGIGGRALALAAASSLGCWPRVLGVGGAGGWPSCAALCSRLAAPSGPKCVASARLGYRPRPPARRQGFRRSLVGAFSTPDNRGADPHHGQADDDHERGHQNTSNLSLSSR
jgi:hypothetical protein